MERFIKGDILVIPFPFSDLSESKRRPTLVLTDLPGDDIILCQITSKNSRDLDSIFLTEEDFETGSLNRPSYIRPNRIFTADKRIILYKIGHIRSSKFQEVREKLTEILDR